MLMEPLGGYQGERAIVVLVHGYRGPVWSIAEGLRDFDADVRVYEQESDTGHSAIITLLSHRQQPVQQALVTDSPARRSLARVLAYLHRRAAIVKLVISALEGHELGDEQLLSVDEVVRVLPGLFGTPCGAMVTVT